MRRLLATSTYFALLVAAIISFAPDYTPSQARQARRGAAVELKPGPSAETVAWHPVHELDACCLSQTDSPPLACGAQIVRLSEPPLSAYQQYPLTCPARAPPQAI